MTHNSTRSPLDQDDFDLNNIFIGREQQVILFNFYFQQWKSTLAKAIADNNAPMLTAPTPHNKIQGLLILLYGRGGFGKSTLLRHYRTIVLQENTLPQSSRVLPCEIIDWENIPESRRSLFTLSQTKEIDAASYFTMLCTQLANALGKKVDDFKHYQRAAQGVKDAQQQANKLIESLRGDERFASLRGVAGTGILNLLRLVPYAGGLLNNKQIADAVQGYAGSGIEVAAEHVIQLHARVQQKLGTRLTDYLEPDLKLGLSLGYDLRDFAKNFPLLIFFDTYEVIDEGDNLLRIVMGAAGQRVGWVIAGRDNLWAGLDQRLRNRGIETGYKELVPASTAKEIDFNAGGIGAFTPSDIAAYFAEIRTRSGTHADLPPVTTDEIDAIWDVTKGIPLTVRIAAAIYLDNGNVTNITKSTQGKRDIVDQMVRRYLLHVRDNEQDRAKLYALAFLRRSDQSTAISAALGLTPEQAKSDFTFTNELSRLHRRYSFIFTEKEEPALHQEVRHFLRLWLLEHRTNPENIAINQQLLAAHEQHFQQLEQHRPYSTLKERLQDDEWLNTFLDLTEQRFWLDPVNGLFSLLPFMLAAAIYRREINEEAGNIGSFFEETIVLPYHNWWTWVNESLTYTTSSAPSTEELHGLEELEKLLSQQRPIFTSSLTTYRHELESALWWRLGEAYQGKDDHKALAWYDKALSRLNAESELREAVARTYYSIAYQLVEEKKFAESLPLLMKTIELKPDYALAYNSRGIAYTELQQYESALADYSTAISNDPNFATAYNNRGTAYDELKQYESALADYSTALSLDPNDATTYNNRGLAYYKLKQYEAAIADCSTALSLDPNYAKAYHNRGLAYDELKQYELALVDYSTVISLDPNDATAYNNRGSAYGNLQKYELAFADYSTAISLDANYANAYYNRGWAYRNLKQYELAIADYTSAFYFDSNLTKAYGSRGLAYLWLKDTAKAIANYHRNHELDSTDINASWMAEWAGMSKERIDRDMATRLEQIANIDPEEYVAYVCRGVALGLRGKLKQGLDEIAQAIPLDPEGWDAYFWQGMLRAYYYREPSHDKETMETFRKALEVELPPILLTPLYWLERDNPAFFARCAKALLEEYDV